MKYPRTFHFPWSEGATSDDKIAKDVSRLIKTGIVVTEKVDGSNTCMTRDACFSRSHAGPPTHASFDAFKAMHDYVKYEIPEGVEVFGEWCFALHSIPYHNLPAYFMVIGIREGNRWWAWRDVAKFCGMNGLASVPELFFGSVDNEAQLLELTIRDASAQSHIGAAPKWEREGVVVRVLESFDDSDFSKCVMKWVRKNHVQTSEHWKNQTIVKNKIKIP